MDKNKITGRLLIGWLIFTLLFGINIYVTNSILIWLGVLWLIYSIYLFFRIKNMIPEGENDGQKTAAGAGE